MPLLSYTHNTQDTVKMIEKVDKGPSDRPVKDVTIKESTAKEVAEPFSVDI